MLRATLPDAAKIQLPIIRLSRTCSNSVNTVYHSKKALQSAIYRGRGGCRRPSCREFPTFSVGKLLSQIHETMPSRQSRTERFEGPLLNVLVRCRRKNWLQVRFSCFETAKNLQRTFLLQARGRFKPVIFLRYYFRSILAHSLSNQQVGRNLP
jgi:hypothetical protein